MPDASEYHALVAQAEAAANAGDLARAGALLRDVLARQEADLGATHVDLASTLNNLAVVYESSGAPAEAERFYRRAYAVACGARDASDPLVVVARSNLLDFCTAHSVPFVAPAVVAPAEPATSSPRPAAAVAGPAAAAGAVPPRRQPARSATMPAASPILEKSGNEVPAASAASGSRAGMLTAVALVAGAVIAFGWWRLGPTARPAITTTVAPAADVQPPAGDRASSSSPPRPADPPPTPAPVAAAAQPTPAPVPDRRDPPPEPPRATTAVADVPRVVVAEVCSDLDTSGAWRCAPVASPAVPGRAAFFTRLASARPTTVQHRWLRDGRERQSVTLRIGASPTTGYRTFSRQTLTPGRWQVVLVAADGSVLRESTFDVR